jgi:hypothetical protein
MNNPDLPPFPVEALPSSVRDLVIATSEMHGVETQLPASLVLAGVSASMGRATEVDSFRRRKAPPNLFFMTAAAPGTAKTVVSDLIMRPVTKRLRKQAELMRDSDDDNAGTPIVYSADVSDQALRKYCAGTKYGVFAVITSDARDLIENITGKLSRGRFAANGFIDGFSGDESATARITRENTYCERPCVSMAALPQVAKMAELYEHPEMISSGLGIRILACIATKTGDGVDEDLVTDAMVNEWETLLDGVSQLYEYSGNPAVLRLGGAAERAYRDFKTETSRLIREEQCGDFGKVLERQNEMVFRLCNVFHAIRWRDEAREKPVVCAEDWLGAAEIVRWYLPQIRSITGVAASSSAARLKQRVLKALKVAQSKKPDGSPVTANDLRMCSGVLQSELESLVAAFPSEFQLVEHRTGGRGRCATFFEVMNAA